MRGSEARPDGTDPDCHQAYPKDSRLLRTMKATNQERNQDDP